MSPSSAALASAIRGSIPSSEQAGLRRAASISSTRLTACAWLPTRAAVEQGSPDHRGRSRPRCHARVNERTTKPPLRIGWSSPSCESDSRAIRSGVREIPSRSARAISGTRSPGRELALEDELPDPELRLRRLGRSRLAHGASLLHATRAVKGRVSAEKWRPKMHAIQPERLRRTCGARRRRSAARSRARRSRSRAASISSTRRTACAWLPIEQPVEQRPPDHRGDLLLQPLGVAGGLGRADALDRGGGEALHEDGAEELQRRRVAGARGDDVDRHAERPERLGERLRGRRRTRAPAWRARGPAPARAGRRRRTARRRPRSATSRFSAGAAVFRSA